MTYSIYPDGSVKVAEKMYDAGELKDAPYLGTTYVNFDLKEMGVGGVNSWGRWPLAPYRVQPDEYEFVVTLRPLNGGR